MGGYTSGRLIYGPPLIWVGLGVMLWAALSALFIYSISELIMLAVSVEESGRMINAILQRLVRMQQPSQLPMPANAIEE